MFTVRDLTAEQVAYIDRVRAGLHRAPLDVRNAAAYYATTLMERGFPVIFGVGHLAHVTGLRPNVVGTLAASPSKYYSDFRIAKRSGGSRVISAPTPALKRIQEWLHENVTSVVEVHPSCHGFVRGRSIVSNALPHVGTSLVFKLDIKDFFPSVSRDRVFRTFRRVGYSITVANLLTDLTTLGGYLPQGAPTSPDLANAAAAEMDFRLTRLADARGVVYTRYADDLTFSGENVGARRTKRALERIVRDCGFRPHEKKARYIGRGGRQQVTGIVVNDKVNWPRDRRRWLRQEVYFLRRFGVEAHLKARGYSGRQYKEFMYGHIYALNSVRPDEAQDHLVALESVEW